MAEVKLTKSELRIQQSRLTQLQKYLPTLQLKKAMLQSEVNDARLEIVRAEEEYKSLFHKLQHHSALISDISSFDPKRATIIKEIKKRYENIAGVEVPIFDTIAFQDYSYNLFDTPAWVDSLIISLRSVIRSKIIIEVIKEKKSALEKELREVSIRVNLFEKILIPRALRNIKKIKIFLGDQLLSAVSQSKVAKTKILERGLASKGGEHAY